MRVVVIGDMEGVSGILKWEQVASFHLLEASGFEPSLDHMIGGPDVSKHSVYMESRRLYTEEVNAAVRGAKAAGATEIVVMDLHGGGTFHNLVPELLEPDCEWIVQEFPGNTELMEEGCDAALFVGMHARAGTPDGVLSHTIKISWENVWLNDTLVGETGILAAFCGTWNCPVVLVTGDDTTCRQATELLGDDLTTVSVKRAFGRFSARQVAPRGARQMIEEGAREALRDLGKVPPYDPGKPCEIRIEFNVPSIVERLSQKPGVEVIGEGIVAARGDDWWSAWSQLYGP